ncbi:MAG TPA: hypothetical protein VHE61_04885 [Opitutaceae bacterium]|nr:hypothetical protein [Opitutaceae bacterium]
MRFPLTILFLLSVSVSFAAGGFHVPAAAPVSDDALLTAIAAVETGNNPAKTGRYGERTRLQILPATWRRFSHVPHSEAVSHPHETDRVARAYLAVIRARLRARHLPETPFLIAACWNAGPDWKKLHSATVSYAERVSNLVEASERKDMVARALAKRVPVIALVDSPTPHGVVH